MPHEKYRLQPGQDNQLPARQLYIGTHHRLVTSALDDLRSAFPHNRIDFFIVSAGYGLLSENEKVRPYDASFSRFGINQAIAQARRLGIRDRLIKVASDSSLAIMVLGHRYLKAIEGPLNVAPLEIYLTGIGTNRYLQRSQRVLWVPAGTQQAQKLGVSPRIVGASIFRDAVDLIVKENAQTSKGTKKSTKMKSALVATLKTVSSVGP